MSLELDHQKEEPKAVEKQSPTDDRIQFVGHSCIWTTLDQQHFFVDANFSPKILCLKRHGELGIDLKNIPNPSALLVTHAHFDHLDLFSYKYFASTIPVIVPVGVGHLVSKFLNNPIHELSPGETFECGSVKIKALPVKHKGWRISGLRYRNCLSYLIQGSKNNVFHSGDSAYGPHFSEIGKEHSIDTACLPIGAYSPSWLMKAQHMNPLDALIALSDLNAKKMVPIHWGSFRVALEQPDDPIIWLKRELEKSSDLEKKVLILNPGESSPLD